MLTRSHYQEKRLSFLTSMIDIKQSVGLEIGACDLPTVKAHEGRCYYADFRSADDMALMWQIPRNTVCEVDYKIDRHKSINNFVKEKFDYILACHVIEHIADPIGYINELRCLLKEGEGRIIFLVVPEKRETLDRTRPSTSIEHILMDYSLKSKLPSFEHVLEFHRHWVGMENGGRLLAVDEAYRYATECLRSGEADAHCHVWTDMEFFKIFRELTTSGFLPGLSLANFQPTPPGYNEFVVVFST